MPLEGIDRQTYLNQKFGGQKQASKIYNTIDVSGREVGIFFQFDKIRRTPNSFNSHKLLFFASKKGKQNQVIESLFYSYFIEGKDIGCLDELIIIAKQNSLDEKAINHYLTSNQDRKDVLGEEIRAKRMGIKGVPCFIINNKYVINGVPEKNRFIHLFDNLVL